MKRVGVRVSGRIQTELEYFTKQYNVKPSYVLQLAFKLSDRRQLEQFLKMRLEDNKDD
ncbi:hypothetical protein ACQKFM_31305 [Paenibacillus xylanexedens]|uniref:hypothetical protein n=1 Tax=Paenibacillus xylanexedens TaxID=528191 RepID=UPI003D01D18F